MKVTANQGDTVDVLCQRHLGSTAIVTEQVLEMNPGLSALGAVLPMGTQVELPDQAPAKNNNTLIQLWD
jgi:phage tail protein X